MNSIRTDVVILLVLLAPTSITKAKPTLTVSPSTRNTGTTLTFTCELSGFSSASMTFTKGTDQIYNCPTGTAAACSASFPSADYSAIDWTQTDKGIFTVSQAQQSRDGGSWTCEVGGGGGISDPVAVAITDSDCGSLSLENGDITYSIGTTYLSIATYSCAEQYTLQGSACRQCLSSGQWSGSQPGCTLSVPIIVVIVLVVIFSGIFVILCIFIIVLSQKRQKMPNAVECSNLYPKGIKTYDRMIQTDF